MKKLLPVALILAGLILILLPSLTNRLIKDETKSSLEYIENISWETLKKNLGNRAEFDYPSIEEVNVKSTLSDIGKINKNLIIGELIIPDLNMNLPIMKGITKTNLLAGAATMKDGEIMGKGNFSLAGHYMKNKTLFGSLMDIKKGSIIKITNKKTIYEYIVYNTLVVLDTESSMISDDISAKRGKPVVSLMTCYYSSKTGKRFFALGELIKEYPYEESLAGK